MIDSVCWPVVRWLSSALERQEQEVVLGYLAECGETAGKALIDVLGLGIRRQAAAWTRWQLWLIFGTLVVPLGFLLSVRLQATAGESAVYLWMYANNWDWAITRSAGFWYVFREVAALVFISWLTLACWSWNAGFLLGCLSKKLFRTEGALLLVRVGLGELTAAPQHVINFWVKPTPFESSAGRNQ